MSSSTTMRSLLSPRRVSILYLLAAEFVIFGLWNPDLFLSTVTMQNVASSQAVVGILALAALVPFIAGEFDITIGTNMALSAAIVAQQTSQHPDRSLLLICVVAVIACGVVGLANGLIVARLNVNSFITTLAMSQVLAALALKISENQQVLAKLPQGFVDAGQGKHWGIPNAAYCTLVLGVVLWYVLGHTVLGRHLFAAGANREAARLSGIRTEGLVIGSFVASGLIAGVAGVVYIAQIGTFSNSVGAPFIFPAFAAIFLGATQFNFRPNVLGTLLAIFTLALGVQGLQLSSDTGQFWITPMFNGVALLIAVVFSRRQAAAPLAADAADPQVDSEAGPAVGDAGADLSAADDRATVHD
ncbi:ABC transporter permease [Aeromicrobium fastidiosum]|uniref:ABC transporter permease n=1 Tax=Aeromicrobium fastidiosum TaxID=52699 RepID=A0A641ARQ5_9ACTN|nr:ABC transporter permease [Aeromicrobium fastidiosum]KAA1379893.1 ABC transporter permease [Aeromicrobium fastidiosum]MBP2389398.1 ribose transport system permease protein [Aeromicrobium fastidiosum]